MLLNKTLILSDVVISHPSIIPVINRFGIRLGVGELTILEIAKEHNLDIDFLLIVLNTYLNRDFFPDIELKEGIITQITNYVEETNRYYIDVQFPNIEKHLFAFIGMSMYNDGGIKPNLLALKELLNKLKQTLTNSTEGFKEAIQLLKDMQGIMVKYLSGNYNDNLCYATIFALHSLEIDMQNHCRIKERILLPIENAHCAGTKFGERIISGGNNAHRVLTKREIEVLKYIVEGNLNKEIADKMNISFQTVLTHRKNIISKLGIKTVSGLTLYAILNGIIKVNP